MIPAKHIYDVWGEGDHLRHFEDIAGTTPACDMTEEDIDHLFDSLWDAPEPDVGETQAEIDDYWEAVIDSTKRGWRLQRDIDMEEEAAELTE